MCPNSLASKTFEKNSVAIPGESELVGIVCGAKLI